jgi:CrcB protein
VIYWYVALGGAVGSVARYALGAAVQQRTSASFPWGTLLINVTGSLLLGFVMQYFSESAAVNSETRALITTGLLGGYTTFSAFSYETVRLIEDGNYRGAALYAGLSVLLSITAAVLGMTAAREVLAIRRVL